MTLPDILFERVPLKYEPIIDPKLLISNLSHELPHTIQRSTPHGTKFCAYLTDASHLDMGWVQRCLQPWANQLLCRQFKACTCSLYLSWFSGPRCVTRGKRAKVAFTISGRWASANSVASQPFCTSRAHFRIPATRRSGPAARGGAPRGEGRQEAKSDR